jgi:hypothetical protein
LLRNMWPIQLAFILFTVCRILLSSLALKDFFVSHTIGPTDLHQSPTPHF